MRPDEVDERLYLDALERTLRAHTVKL
jgi:hypothetical protein